MADFSDRLLEAAGGSWVAPPGSPEKVKVLGKEPHYVAHARGLINLMAASDGSWMWKDPKLSLLLPFWCDLLHDAVYIVVVRSPVSIALSLKRRDGFPLSAAVLLWQVYLVSLLRDLPENAPVLFLSYENLLSSPMASCGRLMEFLLAHSRITQIGSMGPGQLCDRVRTSLCHSAHDAEDMSLLDDGQQRLYSFLKNLVEERESIEGFVAQNYPLYLGWREYLQLWDGVFRFALREERKRFRLFPESKASRDLRNAAQRER